MKLTNFLGVALFAQHTFAHPGESAEEVAQEAAVRRAYLAANERSLAHCADSLKARGNDVAMHKRRAALIEAARAETSTQPYLQERDLDDVININHRSNLTGISPNSTPGTLFSGMNSCVLSPEVTEGPYWVGGELVRENITDGQKGVPLTLHVQLVDIKTCKPIPEVYLEIWHCNSTGVYSGVVASGNGNSNDKSNINTTFHRGLQQSDAEGVVKFRTTFPGHYTGRATHIHVMSTVDATENKNNTITGGSVTHVGQMFFDQGLITQVEKEAPYTNNRQELTTNAKDGILAQEAKTTDPFIEYVMLGDKISDGIFGWLAFGIDTSASQQVSAAGVLTGTGGASAGGDARTSGASSTGTLPASRSMVSSTMAMTVSLSAATSLAAWNWW
ncbi:Intradiol ring-cleavage dioxygenase [Phaeosphaeria sp. MPI-PUGE-AT-0046c]|nr:Intradiol ring-cleavage dioxygenase [Phaeosphaeria sp. MPI-PUGE-AT-0046c]